MCEVLTLKYATKPVLMCLFCSLQKQKVNEETLGYKTYKVKSKPHAHVLYPKLQGSALTLKFSKEGAPFYELTPFGSQPSSSGFTQGKSGIGNPALATVAGAAAADIDGDKRKEYLGCDWLHEISITIRKVKATPMPLEE